MNVDRFLQKIQASTVGAASVARDVFRGGLDDMAALDRYVNNSNDSRRGDPNGPGFGGGSSSSSSSGGVGGGGGRPLNVRFSPKEHDNEDAPKQPKPRPLLVVDDDEERRDPVEAASASYLLRAQTNEDDDPHHSYNDDNDDNDSDDPLRTASGTNRKKNNKSRQRFLDDLDERVSRPMKPMHVETSNANGTGTAPLNNNNNNKWSTALLSSWIPGSSTSTSTTLPFWTGPRGGAAASASAKEEKAGPPLLARFRTYTKRNPDDNNEPPVPVSSAAMLGDDERAQLKALMNSGTTSGDNHGDDLTSKLLPVPHWGRRREGFVAFTLVIMLLIYYWARDRAPADD